MLQQELLKQAIEDCLSENGYHLYAMSIFKKEGELILSVEIDESLDLNQIAAISETISKCLDEVDSSEDRYILDVCSAGIERVIKQADLMRAIGAYVHVDMTDHSSFEGELLVVKEDTITLKVKVKNLYKEQVIKKPEIKKIRHAVKF